ncbi:MAG: protein kinase, partial [Chloroflexi bacterium]|nr:protein kinase [Chloroflexota bacterium]
MICESCGHENREGAKFCGACAVPLGAAVSCSKCGTPNPSGQSFCDSCGAPLEQTQPPAAKTPTPAPALPASFASGRYQVQRFLGEGATKRVYLAHDNRLSRDVAIALIKSARLTEEGIARIQREGQAMGQLGDHPHIVTAYDLGEEAGQPYIVMEYMAGGDLEALIQSKDGEGLPLEDALRIGDEIAQALEHAHGHGIIHRDLKPGNIWLTKDRTAKLGDFGFVLAADRSRLTQAGMMIGTPYYMPPEQALGGEVTAASDLYSLGCVLYEMVAGRPPFPGDDPTAVISQHINNAPVAPSWHTDHCPPDLEELILKLLAKAPDDRPQSAADVREALGRVDPTEKSASHEEGNVL